MSDQAEKLRRLKLIHGTGSTGGVDRINRGGGEGESRRGEHIPPRPAARSIAVTSGKGGVGKTSVATNLALALARHGKRVLLVDGDLSLANVDLLLGVVPQKNLGDVVLGQATIEEVVLDTSEGVRLLPAGSGVEELADLDDFRRERLLREMTRLEAGVDIILLDTGSGIGRQTIHLARAADQVLLVTTPEPTAFADAYATLKVLSRGRLRGRPGLLVNMAATPEEARDIERRIRVVAERFLQIRPEYFGHVLRDESVGLAVRRQEPFLRAFPKSAAARCIESLATRILREPSPPEPIEVDPEGYFQKVANLDD